jgi:hypothetical protein
VPICAPLRDSAVWGGVPRFLARAAPFDSLRWKEVGPPTEAKRQGGNVAKFADIKAITHKVRVFETYVDVTTVQTAKTVFEAYGDYNGASISVKAGSRPAALAEWRHVAEKTED